MSELDELEKKETADVSAQSTQLEQTVESEERWNGMESLERLEQNGTITQKERQILKQFREVEEDYKLHPENYEGESIRKVIYVKKGSPEDPLAYELSGLEDETFGKKVKRTIFKSDDDYLVYDENGRCPWD